MTNDQPIRQSENPPFTPEGTLGPYYPGIFMTHMPGDLSKVAPLLTHRPAGTPIRLKARFLDATGAPVPSLVLESWQANASGRFRHPLDTSSGVLDPHFDGFARLRTDDNGVFEFATIKPGSRGTRAPHLRWTIFASGIDRVDTQIFFEDEACNEEDPVLNSVPAVVRPRLVASRTAPDAYAIDIVMRGKNEMPFFGERSEILAVVKNDRESETRTPAEPLYVIPAAASDSLGAMPPLVAMRLGESDLTRIAPGRPQAAGEAITIGGRILDEDGRPVRRTLIEIWNANTYGRYSHTIDAARNPNPLDPNFYGFGRAVTDDDGYYRFQTIKPGAYLARSDIDWWRPPHVHFSILGGGVRLITQMYFPDDPLNVKDYIHMMIPESARERIVGKRAGQGQNDLLYSFDIVVRGRFQTPFESDVRP